MINTTETRMPDASAGIAFDADLTCFKNINDELHNGYEIFMVKYGNVISAELLHNIFQQLQKVINDRGIENINKPVLEFGVISYIREATNDKE